MSARFIRLLVKAVDEELMWNLFSSVIEDLHHDDFPTSTRIHFLFQQLPNKSIASWHEMLKYSTAVLRRDLTAPLTGQDRTRTVKQLHSLLRHAPLKALRAATHDISSALEVITDALYPSFITSLHCRGQGGALQGIDFVLLDLIRTLGDEHIWPEVTSPLRWMVKPGIGSALIRIATNTPCFSPAGKETKRTYPDLLRCLALASLQAMLGFDVVKREVVIGDQVQDRFNTLLAMVLAQVPWDIPEEDLQSLIGSKKIYPHEDAYDILRCFPTSMITTNLTNAMEETCRAGKEKCFELLEALAWLTRMEDNELNDAMLSAGVFAFFERVARSPLPEDTDGLDYVFECEKKGDALICFGNMLNVMSPSQIARYTTLEVMKLIMKLRDDPELPSRVTRRASDACDAFVGDKIRRNERMADGGYRGLRVRVLRSATAMAPWTTTTGLL
ncbi:hypothetical protein FRB99_008049 [Tulasnella sp. 403]|nr:hypothetical protein FRB99_008049 [Tulasnella sp. 403]